MKSSPDKPLIVFFLLSIGLIFLLTLPGIIANYSGRELGIPVLPLMIIGSWTPNFAAFLVIALVLKRPWGIRELFSRWLMWKESPWWYLLAFSPIGAALLGVWLFSIMDPQAVSDPQYPGIGMLQGFLILTLITGAMGEELGWRGFALPWLQSRFNAFRASVILGAVWGLWHLPLWFTGMGWEEANFWLFAWVGIVVTIILTWLCNNTRGNMLLVTLFHMSFNFGMGLMGQIWNISMPRIIEWMAVVLTIYAAVVLIAKGPATLRGKLPVPLDPESKTWLK